jgi:hypothetical protein
MDDCPLRRLRVRLLALKRDEPDRGKRIEIAEALADLDEIERTTPATAVDEWCRVHAPNWEASKDQREILRTFLTLGPAGASREEIAAILGDDDHGRSSASIGKVRSALSRLRRAWADSGSTATITIAGRDGVYHTHDPVIQALGEVSQKRHR